jgi:hypothetical protein
MNDIRLLKFLGVIIIPIIKYKYAPKQCWCYLLLIL